MSPEDARHGTTAGYSAHKHAKQKPCTPCREAANAAQRANRGQRFMRRCLRCDNRTEANDQVCRSCKATHRFEGSYFESSRDALTGGRWVPRDGIMRWESVA